VSPFQLLDRDLGGAHRHEDIGEAMLDRLEAPIG
jgi:hypothetical protein